MMIDPQFAFWPHRVFLFSRRPAIFAACERLRHRQLKQSLLLKMFGVWNKCYMQSQESINNVQSK